MPRLKHFVEKSREGTYYTIPFTVPENVSRVTVSYSYWQGTNTPAEYNRSRPHG